MIALLFADLAAILAGLVIATCTRWGRECVTAWLLSLRYMLAELPLRAVTGRRRPDPQRIRELEYACEIIARPQDSKSTGLAASISLTANADRLAGLHRVLHDSVADRKIARCYVCECEQYEARSRIPVCAPCELRHRR